MSEPRRKIGPEVWGQVKVAHAGGIGLREIARNMDIPEGTVLARASRENWRRRIEAAKSAAKPSERAIVPACDAVAATIQQRADRHVTRMAVITEKVLPHLEKMKPDEIFNGARNLERFDFVARRNFGLENQPAPGGSLNLNVLLGQAFVQVSTGNHDGPASNP